MTLVIGGRGRLGGALMRGLGDDSVALDRQTYEGWWREDALDDIRATLTSSALGRGVHIASGVLDPRAGGDEIRRVNVLLPTNIIKAMRGTGIPIVTYGTVMETLARADNPYIQSKLELSKFVAECAASGEKVMHVRIHTLYGGGTPSPFMFLGQMAHALENDLPFAMTSGEQLREYHHIDDAAQAIQVLLKSGLCGITDLSYGNPVRLRRLAEAVFDAFGKRDRLKIGSLSQPTGENYGTVFAKNRLISQVEFRESVAGVVEYMTNCVPRNDRMPCHG